MNTEVADITIIGAGPAGLFAAFQAGMLNITSNIIDKSSEVGGQCTALYPEKFIYDIPGHYKITAANFIVELKKQTDRFKPNYYLSQAVVDLSVSNNIWTATTSTGNKVLSKKIIIATGAGFFQPRKPPLENLREFEEKSIFYKITNIKSFNNEVVMIAGGGDSALDWTIELANITKKIYLVHRRVDFRGNPATLKKIEDFAQQGLVQLITPYQLQAISGSNGQLNSVTLKNSKNEYKTISVKKLLLFFGLEFNNKAMLNWTCQPSVEKSFITVDPSTQSTNIHGIFAIGDIATHSSKTKLIVTGFAEAVTACHSAYQQINQKKPVVQYSTVKIKNQHDVKQEA
ncbi:Ferredoxin--NADP reductase [Candidatus Xenohaliotis californiensis]|uniref:Ferredoxin--NADP reductase n=1 Tax=Candidatus Xenohaliotis californiensis TaxID=84677 RepID=A0ABM9N7S0_9RICK|nr:Ferredoxin--NADP reductase [Candidatus Xenohaliotis californiensis]